MAKRRSGPARGQARRSLAGRVCVTPCAVLAALLSFAIDSRAAAADDLDAATAPATGVATEVETEADPGTESDPGAAAAPATESDSDTEVAPESDGASEAEAVPETNGAPEAAPGGGGEADPEAVDEEPDLLFDEAFDEDLEAAPESYPDPLESTNRKILVFNRAVDRFVLDPVTEAYQWAVPKPARNAISRFFLNLGSPKTLVNDCLQLEWKDAGVTTARFVTNSTIGIVGFFDVADHFGLPGHESDFGQTLALAGTPSGPYLLLPILGPSNVRDGFGVLVDGLFQPVNYVLGPMSVTFGPVILQSPGAILIYGGSSGLTLRDRNYAKLKDLETSSVDYYAAMRSGYYQDRVGQIWAHRTGHRSTHEPGEEP